jgi:hypothetical protein
VQKPVFVWSASRQTDVAYVLACAEHMAAQFTRLCAGRWIVVQPAPVHVIQ